MKKGRMLMMMGCVLLAIFVAGCVTPQQQSAFDKQKAQLMEQEKQLNARKSAIDQKEAELNRMMKQAGQKGVGPKADSLFPPKAKPGECYARVFVPSQYEYKTEKKLKHQEKEIVEVIPARYGTVEETVLVKEASERMEVIPAKYGWEEERVLVEPEKRKLVAVPAVYETVTEKVLVREEHLEWKKGKGPIQKVDEITGEIMCLVKEPAIYDTITKRVLKTPATTREVITPAVYKTVKRKVMTSPPQTKVIKIPAEYKTVKVTKLVEQAKSVTRTIPAEYQTVERKVMVSPGHLEWQEILCQTNMTQARITEIQMALKDAGYDPGPIDGEIGVETMGAINKYQADKRLPVTKYLTLETLESLGVSP